MFKIKISLWERVWFKISNFFDNWIYPAYYLKNLLFHRYDLVKIPNMKPYDFNDVSERMEYATFELIKHFIERETPEKYICWYKDPNTGEDLGHKYGENPHYAIMFPEFKNRWIMDLIKDVYNFYTKELPQLENDIEYLTKINAKYFVNFELEDCDGNEEKPENEKVYHLVNTQGKRSLDEEDIKNLNWDLILTYTNNKEDILEENGLTKLIHKCEWEKEHKIQMYLHLAIEVRPYLWT